MTTVAMEKDVFLDHFAQFDNRWAGAPCAVCGKRPANAFMI